MDNMFYEHNVTIVYETFDMLFLTCEFCDFSVNVLALFELYYEDAECPGCRRELCHTIVTPK